MASQKSRNITINWLSKFKAILKWIKGFFGRGINTPPTDEMKASDRINKITLDYYRVTKIDVAEKIENMKMPFILWDYREHLTLDRTRGIVEYIRNIGGGRKISLIYETEDGVDILFDRLSTKRLFSHVEGNPKDVVVDPNETLDYKLTVHYEKRPSLVLEGSYDKRGLPDDFEDFLGEVIDFIQFYGIGEIPDPSFFKKTRRREGELIYCSVIFSQGYKTYYYLTEDDNIRVGDLVIVPAGKDNHKTIVQVVKIEYFKEAEVPFALDKTKSILRKCTEEDIEDLLN